MLAQTWLVQLFGSLRVIAYSAEIEEGAPPKPIERFRTQRNRLLLARLAIQPGKAFSRDELGEMLWPEEDPAVQRNRLRYELTQLRAVLGAEILVTPDNQTVALSPHAASDVARFDATLISVVRVNSAEKRLPLLRTAIGLYRDDLLPGTYLPEPCLPEFDWLTQERERLREAYFDALHRLTLDLEALGLREDARAIRRLAAAHFPDRPLPATNDLPSPQEFPRRSTDRFYGRESEIAELQQWAASDSPVRLFTITGPGGIGKTRLLLEAMRGYWSAFASLSEVTDGEDLYRILHQALQLPSSPGRDTRNQVIEAIRARGNCLLALDNLEHIAESVAPRLQALLAECPGLRCLTTSRRLLMVEGEQEMALQPLPEGNGLALLLDRARSFRPDFASADQSRRSAEQVVRLLEGLPLALELAASRSQVIGPGQMVELLQQRLRFLVQIRPGAEKRHKSLSATLEWSVHLLSTEARRAFAALSVFRGGFSLAAARAVCGDNPPVLNLLEELTLHSLLRISFTEDERARYSMLAVIREFAEEQLMQDEEKGARSNHCNYFVEQSEVLRGKHRAGDWAAVRSLIQEEMENFRATFRFAAANQWHMPLYSLMNCLVVPFFELGFWQDVSELMNHAEVALESDPQRMVRYLALKGAIYRRRGGETIAREAWERQLALYQEQGDAPGCVDVLFDLAGQAIDLGHLERARQLVEEGSQLAEREKLHHKKIVSHILWERLHFAGENFDTARFHADTALRLLEEWEATERANIALITYVGIHAPPTYRVLEQWDRAERILRRALDAAFHNGQIFLIARLLDEFAPILEATNRTTDALTSYYVAREIHGELYSRYRTQSADAFTRACTLHGADALQLSEGASWRDIYPPLCTRLIGTATA